MDPLRTQGHDLQFQTAMTQLPVLEGESEQKYLGVMFLKLKRNDYMFTASLRDECNVYGSRSDVIMCILRNVCPLTKQSHCAWVVCLNGTQRKKNFWPDITLKEMFSKSDAKIIWEICHRTEFSPISLYSPLQPSKQMSLFFASFFNFALYL